MILATLLGLLPVSLHHLMGKVFAVQSNTVGPEKNGPGLLTLVGPAFVILRIFQCIIHNKTRHINRWISQWAMYGTYKCCIL